MNERTVLIVDDDEAILNLLSQILERKGFKTLTADNGKAALALLQQQPVSVILTDIRMPEMDGIMFCTKATARSPKATVFAVSAYADAIPDDAYKAAGFAGRFKKPFDADEIVAACTKAFSSPRAPANLP